MTTEFLQIEPTTRCNFTCGFCCGRSMTQSDLDFAQFERTLAQFRSLRHVELQGEGEPLMHPRFFDMLAATRARGIVVSMITNGSLLTDDNVAQLVAGGIEKISISIESADPDRFRAIRGGKLDKVIAGIARLIAAKHGRALPRIGFSVTMLRSTAGDLDGIIALYQRLGLDGGITTQALQRMPGYLAGYPAAMQDELLDERDADARYVRFYRRTRAIANPTWSKGGFYARLMAGWKPATRRCPWLERGAYVSRDGVVSACCMIKDERHALGRIGDDPAQLVARRDAMRDELASGTTPAACSGCEIARYAVMGKLDLVRRAARVGVAVVKEIVHLPVLA
ncbi:MAG TPA: radical SAM/SPASM domain-containing protein [Kofleriaceae bacterium]|jgi:MoaA/NifB/PqqE/SkfB family radical SAM enzyme|nr:radical SAM/SPASM domain-containing protein [Kofleriaceae bacterium]